MSTKEESKSLIAEPLPISNLSNMVMVDYTLVGKDKVLTSIVQIDEQVDIIQQILQPFIGNLMMQREALLKRAQDEKITEDAGAVLIETEGKKNRNDIVDLETFELQFPGAIEKIRNEQRRKITVKYDKDLSRVPDSDIPLGVADEIVGKDKVTDFVGYQPVKVTYQVQRK
jgi:hypothetical protein